jgi:hypothetical protein
MMVEGLAEAGVASEEHIAALVSSVVEDQRDAVAALLNNITDKLSPEELAAAMSELKGTIEGIEGNAVLAVIAGSFQAATDMAPDIMEVRIAVFLPFSLSVAPRLTILPPPSPHCSTSPLVWLRLGGTCPTSEWRAAVLGPSQPRSS